MTSSTTTVQDMPTTTTVQDMPLNTPLPPVSTEETGLLTDPPSPPPMSEEGQAQTHHHNYKTRLCRFFLKGHCNNSDCTFIHAVMQPCVSYPDNCAYGSECSFLHIENSPLCSAHMQQGGCQGCPLVHPLPVLCKFYFRDHGCKFGPTCKFLHISNGQ